MPSDNNRSTKFGDIGTVSSAHSREMTFVTMNDKAVAITMAATIPPTKAIAPRPVASRTFRAIVSERSGAAVFKGFDSAKSR